MKKTLLSKLAFFAFIAAAALTSCNKDDNTADVAVIERPDINRTVDYTVLVVAGENTITAGGYIKSASASAAAEGATVSVSVGGSVRTVTTDASGQATFTGLTAGTVAVTVSLENHTTCNYIAELYHIDSAAYDNEGKRIASTKVVLFSTEPANMITVSGVVQAQTDITVTFKPWSTYNSEWTFSPELEPVSGASVTATIAPSEIANYVTMIMGGSVENATYESAGFTATTDASGNYSVTVPATAQGLDFNLYAADLATQLTYSVYTYVTTDGSYRVDADGNYALDSKSVRYVFPATSSSLSAVSGRNEVIDLAYGTPWVNDPDYYGSGIFVP